MKETILTILLGLIVVGGACTASRTYPSTEPKSMQDKRQDEEGQEIAKAWDDAREELREELQKQGVELHNLTEEELYRRLQEEILRARKPPLTFTEENAKASERDIFIGALTRAGIDNSIVSRVSQKGDSLTIIVANRWHYQPYQIRLQFVQNFWELWARIRSPNNPDKARLEITDLNGNSVGGSRWLAGSLIWVKK